MKMGALLRFAVCAGLLVGLVVGAALGAPSRDRLRRDNGNLTMFERPRKVAVTVPNDFWFRAGFRQNQGDYSDGQAFAQSDGWGLWHLQEGYLNMPRAWGVTTGTASKVVAVVDAEIMGDHYDLAANIWTNTGEIPGNGIDDDGNGLVDDVHGWDFVSWDASTAYTAAEFAGGEQHGTQMASFIGAVGNNESWTESSLVPNETDQLQGSVGVCWAVSILPTVGVNISSTKAYSSSMLRYNTIDSAVEYICGLKAAGVDISVCSLSLTSVSYYAMSRLYDAGILPVTGSGNHGTHASWWSNPIAMSDSVVAVSAVGANYGRYGGPNEEATANFGENIDVCGYLGNTFNSYYSYAESAWRPTREGYNWRPQMFTLGYAPVGSIASVHNWLANGVGKSTLPSGTLVPMILPSPALTSGATAQVAGLAALLSTRGASTPSALMSALYRGAVNIDAYNQTGCWEEIDDEVVWGPCDGLLGYGRVDAYRALTWWGVVGTAGVTTEVTQDVYVAGDTYLLGQFNFAPGVTVWVAPDDLYQDEIEVNQDCRPQYLFSRTGLTEPVVRLSPNGVAIYAANGSILNFGSGDNVTFRSWAANPGDADWEGIVPQGTAFLFGNYAVLNAAN